MNQSTYAPTNALIDIIAAPGRALDEIKNHTGWFWIPLLITIVLAIIVLSYYNNWVDIDWLVDQQIRSLPPDAPAEAARQVREFTTPGMLTTFTAIGVVVGTFFIYLIQSAYLHLAAKLTGGPEFRFGQWFSFSAWTNFVSVVGVLSMVAMMLVADGNQLRQDELMPLSLNQLFVHAEPGEPWFTWASSLTLVNFWTLALMTIGWHRWVGSSIATSAIIVSLPWVLIFGIWAFTI